MQYYCDEMRHLVCMPYSKENLHRMAEVLDIKRCWFHKDHYDIPKRRLGEIMNHSEVEVVSPMKVLRILKESEETDR